MRTNKILIVLGLVLALLVTLAFVSKKKGWLGTGEVLEVVVEKAAKRSVIEVVTASRKINPQTELKLSSEVSGEVIELNVVEGDSVVKGELMAVVNPSI